MTIILNGGLAQAISFSFMEITSSLVQLQCLALSFNSSFPNHFPPHNPPPPHTLSIIICTQLTDLVTCQMDYISNLQCRKKHTYVCPIFEATGICPQGSTCKLHHPKKRSGLKRKQQSREQQQKNARGRYFGSKMNAGVVAEGIAASPGNLGPKDDDDIFSQEGKFSDYINVDMSDEETDGNCDLTSEQRTILADPSDLQVVDINDMIKPIGIMNKNLVTGSLLAIDSTSEKSASFLSEESDVCK